MMRQSQLVMWSRRQAGNVDVLYSLLMRVRSVLRQRRGAHRGAGEGGRIHELSGLGVHGVQLRRRCPRMQDGDAVACSVGAWLQRSPVGLDLLRATRARLHSTVLLHAFNGGPLQQRASTAQPGSRRGCAERQSLR